MTCTAYAAARAWLPRIISMFSSLLYDARYPRLWLPVITTQLGERGSITTILSWMIACAAGDTFRSSFCQKANWSLIAAAATTVTRGSPGRWTRSVLYLPTAFASVAAPRTKRCGFDFCAARTASKTLGEPGWNNRNNTARCAPAIAANTSVMSIGAVAFLLGLLFAFVLGENHSRTLLPSIVLARTTLFWERNAGACVAPSALSWRQ